MNIEITPTSRARFGQLLNEMQTQLRAELPKLIRNAGRDYVKGAYSATPLAPTSVTTQYRKIIDRSGSKRWVKDASPRAVKLRGRGFAKAAWVKCMQDLGMSPQGSWHTRGGKRFAEFASVDGDWSKKSGDPWVRITSTVPYIEKLDRGGEGNSAHHIALAGIAKAEYAMERALTKQSQRMASRWR